MVIQHRQGQHGIFYIENDEEIQAKMTYVLQPDGSMIIEHTEVSENLRGRNAGFELVHTAVEFARHQHIKIIPVCPFAKCVLSKKPDWADVLQA
ncbi:MAG: GNAT family N-acetyltransferase [Chitinophagaceae bacterium]